MTETGHEDRMLLALEPVAFVIDIEPALEERAHVPRSRNASHGRIIDHFLMKLDLFEDDHEAMDSPPAAARLYQDV